MDVTFKKLYDTIYLHCKFKDEINLTKDDAVLGIKGRISTFIIVLFVNSLYMISYYIRDGFVSPMEYIGLPFMLALSVWFGKQYDKARYYSEKDILTGLYNRRFVDSFFPKIKMISDRKGLNIAVILIDVNNFKLINDQFGHKAGDVLLKSLSRQLEESAGAKDIVARWGGDEFIVISSNHRKREDVEELIGRIHRNLENREYPEISASVGSAIYPSEGETLDQLVNIADRNMYRMKSKKKPSLRNVGGRLPASKGLTR